MIPEEYKLTDEEITEAVYSHQRNNGPSWPKSLYPRDRLVADAATEKAHKVTLEEVKAVMRRLSGTIIAGEVYISRESFLRAIEGLEKGYED